MILSKTCSGAWALCLNPLAEEETFFLRQLALVLLAILKALAPLGAGVSVIAPLPERLPGLIEGSLRPQSSFEYSVPGSYLVVTKPSRGLRKSWSTLVYG